MCNRYRLTQKEKVAEHFQAKAEEEIEALPRYNIAPTQPVLTVRQESGVHRLGMMRWGLIPAWASDIGFGNKTLNARSETVSRLPAFRDAIDSRRCLIPADGFYEWRTLQCVKQPYCFEVNGGSLFAFAGLWDTWKSPGGQAIRSCTILTTSANPLIAPIHDRMPVILAAHEYETWLQSPDWKEASQLLRPFDAASMNFYPVNPALNNPANDSPQSAQRIELPPVAQGVLF
ncbi:MAG: SOS response-associated peptidase [Acidobacteria bacterium]|nr:SOS response-associated peptidase [Acidobacteriota bacterium]